MLRPYDCGGAKTPAGAPNSTHTRGAGRLGAALDRPPQSGDNDSGYRPRGAAGGAEHIAMARKRLSPAARLDRTALSVSSSFAEAEAETVAWWHSRTPEERLRQVEELRRLNYGAQAAGRLQRVLEIARR